jgi:uncharacterized protein YkwD
MRWLVFTSLVACGPIYKDPPALPQQPPPSSGAYQSGPPGGNADPEQPQPYEPVSPAPASRPAPPPVQVTTGVPAAMQSLIDAHNTHRAKHCAGQLTWSPRLADAAQRWASSLKAQGCKFGHSPRNAFGENLAAGTSGTLDGRAVADMWYDEVRLYRFPDGGFSMQTGHFTQLVWRGTTQIGCGVTTCNGMDIYVCEYDPAGNVDTMYRDNVLAAGACRR